MPNYDQLLRNTCIKLKPNDKQEYNELTNATYSGKLSKRYVYLLRWKDTDIYKIGQTNNLANRLEHIQQNVPFVLEMVANNDKRFSAIQGMERLLLSMFKDKRIRGEWFYLNKEDVKSCVEIMSQ